MSGARLRTISQNHTSVIHEDFDYAYVHLVEGTSAMNLRRGTFTEAINHLNNPNKLLTEQMADYYGKTIAPGNCNLRDTGLSQASRELERKVTKLMRTER